MVNLPHPDLQDFLLNLECLNTAGQKEAIMTEVIESGGTYVPPTRGNWSSHLFEIALHGVNAYGASEDEAIRNWKKAARAQVLLCEPADPPFPNPRNHAEEIANAQAAAAAGAS